MSNCRVTSVFLMLRNGGAFPSTAILNLSLWQVAEQIPLGHFLWKHQAKLAEPSPAAAFPLRRAEQQRDNRVAESAGPTIR